MKIINEASSIAQRVVASIMKLMATYLGRDVNGGVNRLGLKF